MTFNKMRKLRLFVIAFLCYCFSYGQYSAKQVEVNFHIDNMITRGPFTALENINDSAGSSFCERELHLSISVKNNTNKIIQLVRNSNLLDINFALFDFDIERLDLNQGKFLEITKNLIDPLLDGEERNLFIEKDSTLNFHMSYSFITRINEVNRIRTILKIPTKQYKYFKFYSKWEEILWNGFQEQSRFGN